MPIKTLGSLEKIRVGRETGNTHLFFWGLRISIIGPLFPNQKPFACTFFSSNSFNVFQFVTLSQESQSLVKNCQFGVSKLCLFSLARLYIPVNNSTVILVGVPGFNHY